MISDGDRIAIGLSGGKDSLALVHALAHFRSVAPIDFELRAITVDAGWPGLDLTAMRRFVEGYGVPLTIVPTQIGEVVFTIRNESNPCALCANMRRGALNSRAAELGCNKLALAHHLDDAIETMLLSLFHEGRFHCFQPVTYLSRKDITVIRPMIYVWERDVAAIARDLEFPIVPNPCPVNHQTQREEMKRLVAELDRRFPGVSHRLAAALKSRPGTLPWGQYRVEG
ncbi:MAG: tRNA 2-thiocytidine biosynthesis TtcA family protein [Chloroflexota bacterium]